MKKSLKVLIFIITICVMFYMLSACSIIGSTNDTNDGVNDDNGITNGDNVSGDNNNANDTNDNSNSSGTVNGLPKITLTEGMTKDEIKLALSECKNYKLSYPLVYPDEYAEINYRFAENGFYMDCYTGTNEKNTVFNSLECRFYDGAYGYDLIYFLPQLDSKEWEYSYSVSEANEELIESYSKPLSTLWSFLDVEDVEYELVVKDGKIIFYMKGDATGEVYPYVFYDFNNTLLNVDHYFSDYKSLEIGEYEGTINSDYVKKLV